MPEAIAPNDAPSEAEVARDDEVQLDMFSAPRERSAVELEAWRRPGTLFLEAPDEVEGLEEAEVDIWMQGPHGPEPAEVPLRHIDRVSALIELRDAARRVLHAELANAPDERVAELRAELNDRYDAFREEWGPINVEPANARGHKRPNLRHFESDPDAPLVAALETVDRENQVYEKAPIFERNVIRMADEPTRAESPRDALAIALDRRGEVDVPFMADLLNMEAGEVVESLAGEIFENPETGAYETAAEYLAGPVRSKLRAAVRAAEEDDRWLVNVEALEAVQPEDLTAEEIEATLGAPWIPVSDVEDFIVELLEVRRGDIRVFQDEHRADWTVRAQRRARRSARAQRVWGTGRKDAFELIRYALNQKDPVVRDRIPGTDPPRYRLNRDATIEAREKMEEIKDEFERWIWSDNDRTVRLTDKYNELYNDRVEREYDGSHLSFPGASAAITLRPHQKDAIWRAIQSGNTLLAHEVGSGKTFIEAGIAMESRRLGMAKKPCLIVPNHMIEQVARDFMQLYPTAQVLVATKKDMRPDNREEFAARIATSDVDAVIMTHRQFMKIPMSPEFEAQLIEEEIAALREPVEGEDAGGRRARQREIEKWQEKLDELGTREDLDFGVTFEETGIDQLIVDESHYFKSLPIDSKNRNRTQSGSQRAEDLYMRARYLNHRTPGRGVVFATGTPIANSIAEMYVLQAYLQRDRLNEIGLHHFDAWAAMFGESVTTFELAPGGGYRINTRFARFKNVPELTTLFREFADVRFSKDLDLPIPDVRGGGPRDIAVEPTDPQEAYLDDLLDRVEAIKAGEVPNTEDNMLKVITDARKAALDYRLIDPDTPAEEASPKLMHVADRVAEMWEQTTEERATQLIFCDLGTPKPNEFDVYHALRDELVARGVDAGEIAFVQDANSDRAKSMLFEAVNRGRIRVLVASTQTAGIGANVQERLKRVVHLDAPWRPCDMSQREGRILRQGNTHDEVEIDRYVTTGSFDAYIYQALERKANFIHQILSGTSQRRSVEDIGDISLSYKTIKAIASGDPLVREKAELEAEIARLERIVRGERNQRHTARKELARIPERRETLKTRAERARRDIEETRIDTSGDAFAYVDLEGVETDDRVEAGEALFEHMESAQHLGMYEGSRRETAGQIGGFTIGFEKVRGMPMKLMARGHGVYKTEVPYEETSGMGLVRRAENLVQRLDEKLAEITEELANLDAEEENLREFVHSTSPQEEQLDTLYERLEEVDDELGITELEAEIAEQEEDDVAPDEPVEEVGQEAHDAERGVRDDQRDRYLDIVDEEEEERRANDPDEEEMTLEEARERARRALRGGRRMAR